MKEVKSLAPATAGCPGCAGRDARIAELEERLRELEAFNRKCLSRIAELESLAAGYAQFREQLEQATGRIRELEALLNRTSDNSHKPPSSDPPWKRKKPKPPSEKPGQEKRKPGGQLGHEGKNRPLLPPDQVNATVVHRPKECEECKAPLPETVGPQDRVVERQQQWEFVDKPVVVTEHQAHAVCLCQRRLKLA
jgi:transposase